MNYKNIFLTAAMALFAVNAVTAQEDTEGRLSYSFVEAQGGIQFTSDDGKLSKLITPTAALSIGHFFTPVIGGRIHVNGWQAKSALQDPERYYKWNYITPSADLMVNLSNLLSSQPKHLLNVMLIGGVGVNYAWNNEVLKDPVWPEKRGNLTRKDNRLSHNLRAGLRFETDVTKKLGLSLEALANNTNDRFTSNITEENFWQFTAMLGISYRFGKTYRNNNPTAIVRSTVKKQVDEDNPDYNPNIPKAPAKPVAEEPAVEEKKVESKVSTNAFGTDTKAVGKKETLKEEIFYVICKSDPTVSGKAQMQRVADFMKKHQDAKVTIVGYADKGTGTAKINKMYADRRASKCRDVLVKQYGCDANRIIIDSKGDTVQPFAENDKNRCVIIGAETQGAE